MINYVNVIEDWSIIEKDYTPVYNKTTNKLTIASKLKKRDNDYAVNAILSMVSESVALTF